MSLQDDIQDALDAYPQVFADAVADSQPCRACGTLFQYDPYADYCPACAAENAGIVRDAS